MGLTAHARPGWYSTLSEEELGADAEALHHARQVAVAAARLVPAGVIDVLELDLQVRVQVPVDSQGQPLLDAALDRAVVQVQVRIARGEFPSPAAPAGAAFGVAHGPEGG